MLIFLNVPLAATGGILALWMRNAIQHFRWGWLHRIIRYRRPDGIVLLTYIAQLREGGLATGDRGGAGPDQVETGIDD